MARPRLEPLHHWILGLWSLALVGFVWLFVFINQGGGWLEELVAPVAIAFFLAGPLVIGLAAAIARFLTSGRHVRVAIIAGIPGLVALWLATWG